MGKEQVGSRRRPDWWILLDSARHPVAVATATVVADVRSGRTWDGFQMHSSQEML